jgi:hypothetical protein
MLSENSGTALVYSYVKLLSGLVNSDDETGTAQAGAYYCSHFYRSQGDAPMKSVEHNYEIDAMSQYGYNWEARWDHNENAWRFFRRYDNASNPGMMEKIWIPANTSVTISCKVKLAPTYAGAKPFLAAIDFISGAGENYIGNSGGADSSQWTGKRYTQQYVGDYDYYETQTLTISSKHYPRTYMAGVLSNDSTSTMGFWVKDFSAVYDSPYVLTQYQWLNNQGSLTQVPAQYKTGVIRIGGGRLQ